MKIEANRVCFDDSYLRGRLSHHENRTLLEAIFSFHGFPEHAIRLSSAIDSLLYRQGADLTPAEAEAIESYVGNSWDYINQFLAMSEMSDQKWLVEDRKTLLMQALDKLPISPMTFYRATRTMGLEWYQTLVDRLENGSISAGTTLKSRSFLSFTSSPYALRPFACDYVAGAEPEDGCIIYRIEGGLRSISKVSANEFEYEGILLPDCTVSVAQTEKLDIPSRSGKTRTVWFVQLEEDARGGTPAFDFHGNPWREWA
ncbi:hypothetical protein SAMN05216345_110186 [Cupriavidus sp. YR651]|uniref:hypothetical protein n=1 Tax=Cupriavidus sp. YR651 TaxID=1855315 RepID=UPI0008827C44|nr:hypothetical protein [Cupriavidus sp. YR651]SDD53429.1 hypothetical protein SAMN05216345_110186 [Cupriavidus sp. YR651]